MANKLKAEDRRLIAADFAKRHGGTFCPVAFLEEVERIGFTHPAYSWFTWDDQDAAHKQRVTEARNFVRKIEINYVINDPEALKIEVSAPAFISPIDNHQNGGGYQIYNPGDQDHVDAFRAEARRALKAFASRYQSVLVSNNLHLTLADVVDLLED